jgi:hypothetical protein
MVKEIVQCNPGAARQLLLSRSNDGSSAGKLISMLHHTMVTAGIQCVCIDLVQNQNWTDAGDPSGCRICQSEAKTNAHCYRRYTQQTAQPR